MTRTYKIIDHQQMNFMDDTHDDPMTANELRHRFWSLDECHTKRYSDFTMGYIEAMWEVEFKYAGYKL